MMRWGKFRVLPELLAGVDPQPMVVEWQANAWTRIVSRRRRDWPVNREQRDLHAD